MYSESDLEAAVAAGALSPAAAQQLRDFVAGRAAGPAADEEHFRLITGFNDIFVGLATVILLVAVGWIANQIPPHIEQGGPSPFAGFFVAATAWGLAEVFTRQRRMALPSIILLLAFTGGVFFTVATSGALVVLNTVGSPAPDREQALVATIVAVSGLVTAGAAWLHWRRFRVPITVAAGVAACLAVVMGIVTAVLPRAEEAETVLLVVALVLGLGVFTYAMRWDASDPRRETRRSDVAFWLHLLAAPLIVHPIFKLLGLTDATGGTGAAVAVVLLYLGLGAAAVAVDRRALLVSALAYVLYALNSLFQTYGAVELSFALTALVIGSGLLVLSAFWNQTRRAVLGPLPETLRARLAPVDRALVGSASA